MVAYFVHALVSIFAVMNPLGILPTYLALTSGLSPQEQRQTSRRAIFISFFILLVFLLLGHLILSTFSITIDAFRVAGGILLFRIAFNLLNAQTSPIQAPDERETAPQVDVHTDITITPLAMPIIAGPGTIASVMALSAGPNLMTHTVAVFLAVVLVLISAYVIFYYSAPINRRIGQAGLNVITRLMGFILSTIAVQMAAVGLAGLFPGWTH